MGEEDDSTFSAILFRHDGTLTIATIEDGELVQNLRIDNPDDIHLKQIVEWDMDGKIIVPNGCTRVAIRRGRNGEPTFHAGAEIIQLIEKING